ncbi:unnamed protein product [Durusdinium trenchii]|uniref:Uncharacterized protein n=1 Tax=Durusdinium trenchii TaxID=1381693 RepID=A0ABP0RBE2_9DINO
MPVLQTVNDADLSASSEELQPVGKGQKNRQPKPKPAQPKKVLPKKRPAAAIESSGHNEDAVAAEEVEPRKSALRKRPAARKNESSETGQAETGQDEAAEGISDKPQQMADGQKLYAPNYYKLSNRWGIKIGKKEVCSVGGSIYPKDVAYEELKKGVSIEKVRAMIAEMKNALRDKLLKKKDAEAEVEPEPTGEATASHEEGAEAMEEETQTVDPEIDPEQGPAK